MMSSGSARIEANQVNIRMHTLGLGWVKDLTFTKLDLSKAGKKVKELADHLRWNIREEKKYKIPKKPVVN